MAVKTKQYVGNLSEKNKEFAVRYTRMFHSDLTIGKESTYEPSSQ